MSPDLSLLCRRCLDTATAMFRQHEERPFTQSELFELYDCLRPSGPELCALHAVTLAVFDRLVARKARRSVTDEDFLTSVREHELCLGVPEVFSIILSR